MGAPRSARLLLVGQAFSPTGFARVCHALAGELPGAHDVHHLGVDFHGPAPVRAVGRRREWWVHPNPTPTDPWALEALAHLLRTLEPQLVWVNAPPRATLELCQVLAGQPCRSIAYTAIGARDALRPRHLPALAALDRLVLYTRFGQAVVEAAADEARRQGTRVPLPALERIPHGVDPACFFPLVTGEGGRPDRAASRRRARERLFADRPELRDAFLVLNANQNQPRKRVDLTLEGFARFARGRPDARLYLHMATGSGAGPSLAERLGISHQVLSTGRSPRHPEVSEERLNLLYNACDVGVNTSTGEGWGLVSFEHGATGAAQLVPRHSACEELWEGHAELLPPVTPDSPGGPPTGVSPEAVAQALERLYTDAAHREALSDAAYANSTRPEYRWDAIARRWEALFQEVLAAPRTPGAA